MWDAHEFLIKIIPTLSMLLIKHVQLTCLRDTRHFYRLGWRKFLQPSLKENFVLVCVLFRKNKMTSLYVQKCSEMVMPIGHDSNGSMFPPSPFNLNEFINGCKSFYGIQPRPQWVTTYYGGRVCSSKLFLSVDSFSAN